MANYNSGFYYNQSPNKNGAFYNSKVYVFTVKIVEILKISENINTLFAKFLLKENTKWRDTLYQEVLFIEKDTMIFKELKHELNNLFKVMDNLKLKDVFNKLIVNATLNDSFKMLPYEELKLFNKILTDENINISDITDLQVAINIADRFKLKDLVNFFAKFKVNQHISMTDKEPKKAVSDFYITKDDTGSYDVIMPFGLIFDKSKSNISLMPESIDNSITIPNADGEIVLDTVYGSRLFDIVSYTMDGLTTSEKAKIKADVTQILHSIKNSTKKLTFADSGTTFDVKYTGLANAKDFPSSVRFDMPMKSTSSYGYKQFTKELDGNGLVMNDGVENVGALISIKGYCKNPSFEFGDTEIQWLNTVNQGEKLLIDTGKETCTLLNENGIKTNAMKWFKGDFKKIPVGSLTVNADENTRSKITTSWRELVLY